MKASVLCAVAGRLAADPETRKTSDGCSVVSFRLTDRRRRNGENGDGWPETVRIEVVIVNDALGRLAENALRKGSRVLVQGVLLRGTGPDLPNDRRATPEIILHGTNSALVMLDVAMHVGPTGTGVVDRGK